VIYGQRDFLSLVVNDVFEGSLRVAVEVRTFPHRGEMRAKDQ
jgi:hypothetical protein